MQNLEAVENSKKEDKKHFKKFVLKTVLGLLGGGIVGWFIGMRIGYLIKHQKTIDSYSIMHQLQIQTGSVFRILVFVVAVCCIVALSISYWKAKHKMEECNIEDEEQCESVEKIVALGIWISGMGSLLLLLCLGMGAGSLSDIAKKGELILMLRSVVAFFGYFVLSSFFQNRFVTMLKALYPEKKGSIYDAKFQKKWMESCDEAERLMIYQVCYKVLMAMNYVYSGAAVIFLLLSMIFGISSLIFLTIMVLWIISQGVYFYASAKIEKNFIQ